MHHAEVPINPVLARSFKLLNSLTLLAWIPLFVRPDWVLARQELWLAFVAFLCACYAYFLFAGQRHDGESAKPRGHFFSLAGVLSLFASPRATLSGWIHYLAFDLMMGLYILQANQQVGLSHWLVVPCLLGTFMFGPAGLLAWWGLSLLLG